MLRALSDSFLSVLYPEECRVCGGEVESHFDGVACSPCWSSTKLFTGTETLCSKCGAFLFTGASSRQTFCRKCDDQHFDFVISIGAYETALAAAVLSLKKTPRLSGRLRNLLIKPTDTILDRVPDIVMPVPLSRRRLQERGFNQAAIIGKSVSRRLGIPLDETTLVRHLDTPMHRAGMDRKARGMTVKNAFDVARPKLVKGKNIVIVDDVLTSGETVSSCARILKKNGAARVDVITLARAA